MQHKYTKQQIVDTLTVFLMNSNSPALKSANPITSSNIDTIQPVNVLEFISDDEDENDDNSSKSKNSTSSTSNKS